MHDATPAHALCQILVRRADDDALDARIGARFRRRRREGVVGFVVDHRPQRDARGDERFFEQRELRGEVGRNARARLVAGIEPIAKRLDDTIGRDADVRRAFPCETLQRSHDAARRRDLASLRVARRR